MSSDLQQTGSRPDGANDGVAERGKQVASQATEAARTVTTEATDQAKVVVGQARQEVERLVGQTRDELQTRAREQGDRAAHGLRSLSRQLDALAAGRPDEAGSLTTYLTDAQDRVSALAQRLETGGPQAVLDDVTRFARRRPGMFLALAAGTGFLVGRLARSGAAARQDQQQQPRSSNGPRQLPNPTPTSPELNTPPVWEAPVQTGYPA
jgi:hypothetical protein